MRHRSAPISDHHATKHVCVVDGDPAVRDSLETLIGLHGQVVDTFETGAELLASLDRHAADCIISAAELPDMSGLQLFAAVRASHPGVRFALMLSRNDHPAIAAARRQGVDAVFHKPLVHRRLRDFVAPA